MSTLLANCSVTSIRTLVMIMGGVAVDALKADVKTLPKLKGVNIPRSVRRAIVKALAKSSWFALLGIFRLERGKGCGVVAVAGDLMPLGIAAVFGCGCSPSG